MPFLLISFIYKNLLLKMNEEAIKKDNIKIALVLSSN